MDDWAFEQEFEFADEPLNIQSSLSLKQVQQLLSMRWSLFLAAVLLFVSARTIAHRAMTFYISGAVFGAVLSTLFLAVFIRKFLPKKILNIPIDLLGWPAVSYIYYYGYNHAQDIFKQNWKWLTLYMVTAIVISLVVCYVSDVSSNIRVRNVLQWFLQLAAVLTMFYSSQNVPLVVVIVLSIVAIDRGLYLYAVYFIKWLNKKPKSRKLLTMEEYEQEGQECTRQELEKLRTTMIDDFRFSLPNKSLASRCSNSEQLAQFLMTSRDVSVHSQLEYLNEFSKVDDNDDDCDSFMEVDSGTEENLLLTDDDY